MSRFDAFKYLNKEKSNDSSDESIGIIFVGIGRVTKTIFGDNTDDEDFIKNGQWEAMGGIKFELVYQNKPYEIFKPNKEIINKTTNNSIAYPININISHYPLENELVYLFTGPSPEDLDRKGTPKLYYLGPIAVWNDTNHNSVPNLTKLKSIIEQSSPNKQENFQGISANNIPSTGSFNPPINGENFSESSIPRPLVFNGDIIYHGRFGQSIRFGHSTPLRRGQNLWSEPNKLTSDKSPITIINNSMEMRGDKFEPQTEDINKDGASMWLTSNQSIPVDVQEFKLNSYEKKPEEFKIYSGQQNIQVGDRVMMWARKDSVFILGKQSVSICSPNTVNIDSDKKIFLTTSKVILGATELEEKNAEPILLGKKTVDKLIELLTDLSVFSFQISLISETGLSSAVQGIRASAEFLKNKCDSLKTSIDYNKQNGSSILSEVTFTK